MKITGNSGLNPLSATGKVKPPVDKTSNQSSAAGQFDQISFSQSLEGESKLYQETSAKIANEVRTHNTTSKIAELKEQVQSGTYQMDARETASRILLMGAVE